MEEVQITKPKGEYDSDDEYEPPAVLHGRESVEREEREREFKEITESATLDDIKEIADILGVAYQVWYVKIDISELQPKNILLVVEYYINYLSI